ncbi:MAG: hypothetical protein ACTSPQ_15715 [Candidatus Helarchaeota archaeon]
MHITFDTILKELKKEWERIKPETFQEYSNLFNILKDLYEFIYTVKKWPHTINSNSIKGKKPALTNFMEEKFSSLT